MKKLFLIPLLSSSIAYGTEFYNQEVKGCYEDDDGRHCEIVFDGEWFEPMSAMKLTGRAKSKFVKTASKETGQGIGFIQSLLESIRQKTLEMGYEEFEGTLSGPSGRVSFKYNFRTNVWTLSNGPISAPATGGEKKIDPISSGGPM